MNDGMTHWAGCYREHHACAIAEADRLRARVEDLYGERRRDALDGQAALDEANNRVAELVRIYCALVEKYDSKCAALERYEQWAAQAEAVRVAGVVFVCHGTNGSLRTLGTALSSCPPLESINKAALAAEGEER